VTVFYAVMASLVALTLLPSGLFLLLYAVAGEPVCLQRARVLFNLGRVLALIAFNIGVWGSVLAALWGLWH
jgi:hypothetical protein